jgi:hypothetical protein
MSATNTFRITGEVVRVPKKDLRNDYGIVKWGEYYVFVHSKLIIKSSVQFTLEARVTCSITWSKKFEKYQACALHAS